MIKSPSGHSDPSGNPPGYPPGKPPAILGTARLKSGKPPGAIR